MVAIDVLYALRPAVHRRVAYLEGLLGPGSVIGPRSHPPGCLRLALQPAEAQAAPFLASVGGGELGIGGGGPGLGAQRRLGAIAIVLAGAP